MESGMHDDYVRRKHGESRVEYPLPQLEPILKETYGVILYQEQVMQIAAAVSGFTLAEADLLRRAMGKKGPGGNGGPAGPVRLRGRGPAVPKGKAAELFSLIEKFAGYGFNKSHSAAYALVAYQRRISRPTTLGSFWLRCSTAKSTTPRPWPSTSWRPGTRASSFCRRTINRSQRDFTVEDGKVRYGLAGVKNVGVGAIHDIVEARGAVPL